jgi:hypothetical protein
MIFLPSFMKIGTGVEGIIRFGLSNLKGCNVGTTGGSDLSNTPLKCAQATLYTHQLS